MWSGVGSITLQGNDFYPLSFSARCIVTFWWIFSVIVQNTYQSNMTASLTRVIYQSSINDMGDLLISQNVKPIIIAGTNAVNLFRDAPTGSFYSKIWNIIKDQPKITSFADAYKLISETGKYCLISDHSIISAEALSNCTIYKMSTDFFNIASFAFPVRKGAVYTKAFNYYLGKMKEGGLIQRLRKKWWQFDRICLETTTKSNSLDLKAVGGTFIILCIFLVMACIILILENVRKQCERKREQPPSANATPHLVVIPPE
ncbi:Glutamate receptor ionotropic, delta-2 [Cichlidogyrus casuarinus]|uniref:Glutamate receptor ionotropic, delta-2 n=1 Tax=Cichlidogyrus casuarinus TaxID=1844966 RepID=A0ABD2PWK4_9PLAT